MDPEGAEPLHDAGAFSVGDVAVIAGLGIETDAYQVAERDMEELAFAHGAPRLVRAGVSRLGHGRVGVDRAVRGAPASGQQALLVAVDSRLVPEHVVHGLDAPAHAILQRGEEAAVLVGFERLSVWHAARGDNHDFERFLHDGHLLGRVGVWKRRGRPTRRWGRAGLR